MRPDRLPLTNLPNEPVFASAGRPDPVCYESFPELRGVGRRSHFGTAGNPTGPAGPDPFPGFSTVKERWNEAKSERRRRRRPGRRIGSPGFSLTGEVGGSSGSAFPSMGNGCDRGSAFRRVLGAWRTIGAGPNQLVSSRNPLIGQSGVRNPVAFPGSAPRLRGEIPSRIAPGSSWARSLRHCAPSLVVRPRRDRALLLDRESGRCDLGLYDPFLFRLEVDRHFFTHSGSYRPCTFIIS